LPLSTAERTHNDAKDRAEFILKMHAITKKNIEHMNEKYRLASSKGRKEVKLEPGDLVWLHLRKRSISRFEKA
jgi:translation initiation factor IF-1